MREDDRWRTVASLRAQCASARRDVEVSAVELRAALKSPRDAVSLSRSRTDAVLDESRVLVAWEPWSGPRADRSPGRQDDSPDAT